MIRGIHHIAINTPDLERMVRFYVDIVGFEVVEEATFAWSGQPAIDAILGVPGSAGRTVMLRAANAYIEFFEYDSPPSRGGERLRPNDHGYTHICLDVEDIDAEYVRLSANGMTFGATPFEGPIRAVYGRDPDGNVLEIQEVGSDHAMSMARLRGLTTPA